MMQSSQLPSLPRLTPSLCQICGTSPSWQMRGGELESIPATAQRALFKAWVNEHLQPKVASALIGVSGEADKLVCSHHKSIKDFGGRKLLDMRPRRRP